MNTRNALIRLTLLTVLTVLAVGPAYGQANQFPPGKMTFQGFLTDASSPPVPLGSTTPENKSVTFKIYKSATGTASSDVLWAEQQVVTVDKGHFSVLLGEGSSVTGLPHNNDLSGVFIGADASDRWIGITLDGAEITPRIQFFAAPYAQLARVANSIGGSSGGAVLTTSGSNVGIGTSSPTAKLDVNGNVNATGSVSSSGSIAGLIFNDRGGAGPTWQWYSDGGTARLWAGGDKITVSTGGRIGAAGLDVTGSSTFSGDLVINDKTILLRGATDVNHGIGWYGSGKQFAAVSVDGPVMFGFSNGALGTMNGGQKLVLNWNSSGNVGIGTTSPAQALDVNGKITLMDNSRTYPAGIMTEVSSGLLNFGINEGSGNRFGAAKTAAQGGMFRFDTRSGEPVMSIFTRPAGDTSSAGHQRLVVLANGDVGIGNNSPGAKLDVMGDIKASGSVTAGSISTSGGVTAGSVTTDGSVTAGSVSSSGNINASNGSVTTSGGLAGLIFNNREGSSSWQWYSTGGTARLWNSGDKVAVTSDGKMGIGIGAPRAPLHVRKADPNVATADRITGKDLSAGVYLGSDGGVAFTSGADGGLGDNQTIKFGALSAVFEGDTIVQAHMWTGRALEFSDARAKHLLGPSDSAQDLSVLRDIRVRDFTWIDKTVDNHSPHKKLLAQEVEQVFPQAVQRTPVPTAIPNVYQVATKLEFNAANKELRLTLGKPHDFKVGDSVDLYTDDAPLKNVKVTAVANEREFTVACDHAPKSVFVYGKYVTDFRSVDYDAIAMLNVSATQELARQTEALQKRMSELESRERQIAVLEKRVSELEGLERQVSELQKLVAALAAGREQRKQLTAERVSNPAGE